LSLSRHIEVDEAEPGVEADRRRLGIHHHAQTPDRLSLTRVVLEAPIEVRLATAKVTAIVLGGRA
jgi:hypothetical protein